MQNEHVNLFTRDDTFFGICQGLGEDFGFNPNLLRLAFPLLLFLQPVATIVGYFGLGVLVLLSRLIAPDPRPAKSAEAVEAVEAAAAEPESEAEPMPLAA